MHARRLPFLLIFCFASLALAVPAPNNLPTIDDLKQQLAEGKSQDVMRNVQKLLNLKGDAAASYDRYELFMLRGEAALRNKAMPMAAESFANAAKETTDEQKKSIARANEILTRKSKATGYVSKANASLRPAPGQKPPGPLPIIDQADRKAAMTALFSDEFTAIQPKLNAAKNATSLNPIADAAKTLGDMQALEVAATDSSEKTKSISAEIGDRAHTLISDALRTMQARTEEIWASASRKTYNEDQFGRKTYNTGLWGTTSTEQNDLKGIIGTCEKVTPTAQDFATVTGNAALKTDAEQAQQLWARAKEVLEYDYANAGRYKLTPPIQKGNLPPGAQIPGQVK
jgi:hypothetical protein